MEIIDTVIIGAGPSGIKASILLKEAGFNVVLVEKSAPGGKVNIAPRVDNYPGYKPISGPDLAFELFNKMNNAKVSFVGDEVVSIKKDNNLFYLSLTNSSLISKTVLIASGTKEKKLPFIDEGKYLGHGLSYCALCDGHFFKGKTIAIYMGDDHAIDDALYLSDLVEKLVVISNDNKIKGNGKKVTELDAKNNVTFIYNSEVIEVKGDSHIESVVLSNKEEIKCDGFFPLIGHIPNTEFIDFDILNSKKEIIVDKDMKTSIPGLFAAGDVINRDIHQIYLSELDAIKAVESIKKYIYNI